MGVWRLDQKRHQPSGGQAWECAPQASKHLMNLNNGNTRQTIRHRHRLKAKPLQIAAQVLKPDRWVFGMNHRTAHQTLLEAAGSHPTHRAKTHTVQYDR